MFLLRTLLLLSPFTGLTAFQLQMTSTTSPSSSTRRSFLHTAGILSSTTLLPSPSYASDEDTSKDPYADFLTTESGLKYKVIKEGNGSIPVSGATVKTQYTGWLESFDSIRKFDSSRDRGKTFNFKVGAGQVIRGWDESFGTMSIGERRLVIIPPRLGYGDRGAGGIIPGGATLYFDVELVGTL